MGRPGLATLNWRRASEAPCVSGTESKTLHACSQACARIAKMGWARRPAVDAARGRANSPGLGGHGLFLAATFWALKRLWFHVGGFLRHSRAYRNDGVRRVRTPSLPILDAVLLDIFSGILLVLKPCRHPSTA